MGTVDRRRVWFGDTRARQLVLALVCVCGAAAVSADPLPALAVQVALDRAGFSPGEIDGVAGPRTRSALAAFQKAEGLPADGRPNDATMARLAPPSDPLMPYTITDSDAAGPFVEQVPDDMIERSRLKTLAYTSVLEALSERFHSSPALLLRLNPDAAWAAGEQVRVPAVEPFEVPSKPQKPMPGVAVFVDGTSKSLTVEDANGRTVMYAPITVGSRRDPLPLGQWKVVGVSWNPEFHYNPDLFWDADPAHAKATIAAGPNNPVGVVWVDINKEHFGLHGTPEPGAIGRVESHGCIRLTNWDAARLGRLVGPGTPVTIRP